MPCLVKCGGPDGVALPVRRGVFPVSAPVGLGPWGVPQTSHEGSVEGTENLVHKGCVRCSGFRLSADGGQQLSAQRHARIWWIAKTRHRFPVAGVSAARSCWGLASSCCPPSRWNLHVADQSLVCDQRR